MINFKPKNTSPLLIHVQASFLIPPEIVPGRMTLLVTLFLVLINIFTNITTNSPNVEGLTSISAWVITCILFVFGALLGFTGMLFKKNHLAKVLLLSIYLKLVRTKKSAYQIIDNFYGSTL